MRTAIVLLALISVSAWANRPSELISGPEGLTAKQSAGVLWHRLEISYNGEVLLSKRLRSRDRAGDWKIVLQGQPVRVVCRTVNGYSLELDCTFYGPSRIGTLQLPFDAPAAVTNGPSELSARRTTGDLKEEIEILWRGETVMDGSMWFRDKSITLKGAIDGQKARSHCETATDFTRVIACEVYRAGEHSSVVAQLRVPLF